MIKLMDLASPLTLSTGATSNVSVNGTFGAGDIVPPWLDKRITTADRAGAGIVTAVVVVATLALGFWLL